MRLALSILISITKAASSEELQNSNTPVLTCLSDIDPKIAKKCDICCRYFDFKREHYNYTNESPSVIKEFKNIEERELKIKKYLVCSNTNCGTARHALCILNTIGLRKFVRTGSIYFDCKCCKEVVNVFDSNSVKNNINKYLLDRSPLAFTNLLYYLRISNTNLSNMMPYHATICLPLLHKLEREHEISAFRLKTELHTGRICFKSDSKFSEVLKALKAHLASSNEFAFKINIKTLNEVKDYQAEDYHALKSSVFEMLEIVTDDVYELYSPVFTAVLKQCISLISNRKDRADFISELILSKYSYLLCINNYEIFYSFQMPEFNAVLLVFHQKLFDPKCYESIIKNNSLDITCQFLRKWSKACHQNINWLILHMIKSVFKNEMSDSILNNHTDTEGHKIILFEMFFSGNNKEVSKNPKDYTGIIYELALKCYFEQEEETIRSRFMSFLKIATFCEKKYKHLPRIHQFLVLLHCSFYRTGYWSRWKDITIQDVGNDCLSLYYRHSFKCRLFEDLYTHISSEDFNQHLKANVLLPGFYEWTNQKLISPLIEDLECKLLATLCKQPIIYTCFSEKNVLDVFNKICLRDGPHKTGNLALSVNSFAELKKAFDRTSKYLNVSFVQANVYAWCKEINFIGFEKLLNHIYYVEKTRSCFISLYYSHIVQYFENIVCRSLLEKTIQRSIALVVLIATSDIDSVKITDVFNTLLNAGNKFININNWFCNLACAQKVTVLDYIMENLATKNDSFTHSHDDFKLAFLDFYRLQKSLFPEYLKRHNPRRQIVLCEQLSFLTKTFALEQHRFIDMLLSMDSQFIIYFELENSSFYTFMQRNITFIPERIINKL
ncbi:hypothetical protein ENBRE01_2311 [Enteropsectra breve]|nr:hypothetical protein ENBRE01_2311 [Enteropsectra breve]